MWAHSNHALYKYYVEIIWTQNFGYESEMSEGKFGQGKLGQIGIFQLISIILFHKTKVGIYRVQFQAWPNISISNINSSINIV